MKDRQTVGAQPAFHNHESHLSDGGIAQGLFDVVLNQHHGRAENGCQHADSENQMKRRRA